jgi:hypothetical protein
MVFLHHRCCMTSADEAAHPYYFSEHMAAQKCSVHWGSGTNSNDAPAPATSLPARRDDLRWVPAVRAGNLSLPARRDVLRWVPAVRDNLTNICQVLARAPIAQPQKAYRRRGVHRSERQFDADQPNRIWRYARVNNSRRRSLQSMSAIRRLNAEQRALVLGRQDVQKAIGTLPHVADALVQLLPHRIAAKFLPFVMRTIRCN